MKIQSAVAFCLLIATLLLLVGTASAVTTTWTGATNNNWATATNWNNGVPAAGYDVILTGTGPNLPTTQNIAGLSINSLTFNSSTTTAFTVGTDSITLTGTGTDLTIAPGAAGSTIS